MKQQIRYTKRKKILLYGSVVAFIISLIILTIISNSLHQDITDNRWLPAQIFNKVTSVFLEYFVIDFVLEQSLNGWKNPPDIQRLYRLCQPVMIVYMMSVGARALYMQIVHPSREMNYALMPLVVPVLVLMMYAFDVKSKGKKLTVLNIAIISLLSVISVLAVICEVFLWIKTI